MKAWTLTDQVNKRWLKCLDLIHSIKTETEPPRLEIMKEQLAAGVAEAVFLFILTQADVKDFCKTLDMLRAAVSAWVTSEISPDPADKIGRVEIEFIPQEPAENSDGPGAATSTENSEEKTAGAEPPGSQ